MVKRLFFFLITTILVWGLVACGSDRIKTSKRFGIDASSQTNQVNQLSEVGPPLAIQELSESLEAYQPQVIIVRPGDDMVLEDTTVSVKFQVQDLPIFQDPDLGIGPHLNVILDNQPFQAIYDLDQPLILEDLSPGTHTLRAFASRPWDESFKNKGAYAQTTFHIFTKTDDNNPDPALPLLTYSVPKGDYGAEPILLDFYLTNTPLSNTPVQLVDQDNLDDDSVDWRIRVTVNGKSFLLDRWESIYLTGFKEGKNWVELEFLDEQGNPVKNVFNNTVQVINYQPNGEDTLSQLVLGQLSAEQAGGIVDPNYQPPPTPIPVPEETPAPSPSLTTSPTVEPTPIPSVVPIVEEPLTSEPTSLEQETTEEDTTSPGELAPTETEQIPELEESVTPSELPIILEEATPEVEPNLPELETTLEAEELVPASETPAPVEEATTETESVNPLPEPSEKPKLNIWSRFGSFFGRSPVTPSPSPEPLEELEITSEEPVVAPSESESTTVVDEISEEAVVETGESESTTVVEDSSEQPAVAPSESESTTVVDEILEEAVVETGESESTTVVEEIQEEPPVETGESESTTVVEEISEQPAVETGESESTNVVEDSSE
ncbi:hypothetical protein BJP34_09765 [Moorena producens PAL-8-15-08-1]|uniref:FHA domain containing protein n=1 Tax=Moorena producens PAL-8-15-08-1 TaxID=1458985 RepID=A0A1D8TQM3_9CYAN|nr:hypothetical protein [Moorena producens]AOW99705.1 hypothetical protein BJP34_09765 [Moorena producens PAL-8-15-08-1]